MMVYTSRKIIKKKSLTHYCKKAKFTIMRNVAVPIIKLILKKIFDCIYLYASFDGRRRYSRFFFISCYLRERERGGLKGEKTVARKYLYF